MKLPGRLPREVLNKLEYVLRMAKKHIYENKNTPKTALYLYSRLVDYVVVVVVVWAWWFGNSWDNVMKENYLD